MKKVFLLIFQISILVVPLTISYGAELPKVAVWDLTSGDIEAVYAQDLTLILMSEIVKLKKYEVYTQENVRGLPGWTEERTKLGCTSIECLTALSRVEIAKLISGSVAKIGNRYSISLNLFDTQNTRVENMISEFCRSEDELIDLVQVAVRKLLGEEVLPSKAEEKKPEKETTVAASPKLGKSLGIYVGALGGVAFPVDMKTTITDNTTARSFETRYSLDIGWLAGVKVGYLMPFTYRILAAELEYNHIENGFDSGKTYQILGLPLKFDSKVKVDAYMLNLIARYPEGKLHPYVGAGAGYGYLEIYDIEAKSAGNKVLFLSGDVDNVFAYQFLAGLNFDITKNWFLGLGYKYFHPDRVSYGTSVNGTSVTSPLTTGRDQGFTDADYQSHNIVVTIGYLF